MFSRAIKQFTDWCIHPDLGQDPVQLLRARFSVFLAVPGTIISFALMGWTYHLRPEAIALLKGQSLIIISLFGTVFLLKWRRTFHLPAHLQILMCTAVVIHAAVYTGGLDSAALLMYPAIPVAAMMVAGVRSMLVTVAGLLGSVIWMYVYEGTSVIPQPVFAPSSELMLPVLGWSVLLTTGLVWYFQRQIIRTMRSSEAEIVRRITVEAELRETEDALRGAKGVAERANAAKGAFLAQVSHEIRNPLTALIGAIDLLELPAEDGVRQARIGLLRQSTRTLGELVDDILDFSKIEAGKLSITPVATNPVLLVEAIEEMYRAQAIAKGLDLLLDLGPDIPDAVMLDPMRIEQVLRNLMSNAIKFTPAGQVTLELDCHTTDEGERHLVLGVEDTGIGIPENQVGQIFEPYVQAEHAPSLQYSGTGLGLPISSRLVRLMGGELGLESTVGEGTRFWVSVPLVEANLSHPIESEVPSPTSKNTRVVIVEDDDANRTILRDLLESLGAHVAVAPTGEHGVELINTQRPEIVLMDIRMPGIDGMEATRRVRADEQSKGLSKIPIIALTADVEVDRVAAYQDAGMTDLLPKPVTRAQLAKVLETWTPHPSLQN